MEGYQPMRLLLAARLSQLADRQTGLDTQDEDSRHWATANGHTIVGVAADHISGRVSPFRRKHLGPWLSDPKLMATYDGILATKIDRLTRKRDWDIRQWAEDHDKKILIASPELQWPPEPGDLSTSLIWDNLVNLAVAEWENTSLRYLRMQKALRQQGYFVGKKPYGYRIVELGDHKTLEPDPVTGAIVRGMAKRYLEGQSLRQIVDWLNSSAIPAPQPPRKRIGKGWEPTAVNRILRNPAIIGRVQVKGRTALKVEPLISVEDYRRIQDMLDSRASRGAPQETALLTSILICPRGHTMPRIRGRGWRANPNPEWYYCRECRKGQRLMVPLAEMDATVEEAVEAIADQPHKIVTIKPGDSYGEEIKQIKEEMHRQVDAENWDEVPALRAEIERLRHLPRKKPEIIEDYDGRTVWEVWQSLDIAGKRRWLLARRPANWLPDQSTEQLGARVQVFGRDPETGALITDIDLGELTDSMLSSAKV